MTDSSIRFKGKVALVCGAGRGGIGTATSRLLAESGADIFAVDQSDELLDETREMVEKIGTKCATLKVDLRDQAQAALVVDAAMKAFGRIDLVANIAGGVLPGQWQKLESTTSAIYSAVMALNVDYVFTICRDAANVMISQGTGGAIVNVASASTFAAAPYHGPYGAAKRAVIALSQTMAVEWGRQGIRVNVVGPGSTRTTQAEILDVNKTLDKQAKEWAPLARPVEKEEVASAIRFLLSDMASAITGQLLYVDCGVTARCAVAPAEHLARHVKA